MDELRGLIEQLIGLVGKLSGQVSQIQEDVAGLKQDVAGLKQDVAALKHEMAEVKQDLALTKLEMQTGFRNLETIMIRFVKAADEDGKALRTQVDNSMERRSWLTEERLRKEWQTKQDDLERRIADLEATERKRQQGQGA